MSVYQVAGTTLTISGDSGSGSLDVGDAINPITGSIGVKTVRIQNTGSNLATTTFTPQNVTYNFANVAYTTDSVDGANAVIDISVTFSGYVATFVDAGVDFLADETISILGSAVGGTTTANDLVITITDVDANGAITGSTIAGTELWPQSATSSITILPNSDAFIQVTNSAGIGCYFTGDNTDTGNIHINNVNIVG